MYLLFWFIIIIIETFCFSHLLTFQVQYSVGHDNDNSLKSHLILDSDQFPAPADKHAAFTMFHCGGAVFGWWYEWYKLGLGQM